MKRISNKQAREYVQRTEEFKGSNLSAEWKGKLYIVTSYGWYPLLVFDRLSGTWFENSTKYSPSTSRQLSNCHPWFETVKLDREAINRLVGEAHIFHTNESKAV